VKRIAIKDLNFDLKWDLGHLPEEQQVKWELMNDAAEDHLLFERIKVLYPRKIRTLEKVIDFLYAQMEKE
jgi:hypothetical protein